MYVGKIARIVVIINSLAMLLVWSVVGEEFVGYGCNYGSHRPSSAPYEGSVFKEGD